MSPRRRRGVAPAVAPNTRGGLGTFTARRPFLWLMPLYSARVCARHGRASDSGCWPAWATSMCGPRS
eukprot:7528050-Lingulodinium_polyedra.AAC.1